MQSFEDYTSQAKAMDFRTKCWIDGQFIQAISGKTFDCINPATGEKLCDVARGDGDDIDAACGQLVGEVVDRTRRAERHRAGRSDHSLLESG